MQKFTEIYHFFRQKKEAHILNAQKEDTQDRGRSMVEMLGVLAIIGVLSISAIFGYSYAMDKRRTNDLINEINLRTQLAITQLVRQNTIDLSEFPQTVEATTIDWGYESPYILFEVKTLTKRMCKMVQENSPAYWRILVDDTEGKECGESNIVTIEISDEGDEAGGTTPDPDPEPDPEDPKCPEGTTPGTGADKGKCCAGGQCCPNGAAPGTGANAGKCCLNEACCAAGQTPYCQQYNADGGCEYTECAPTECTPVQLGISGACCAADETPYCLQYNTDGSCGYAMCGPAGCTPAQLGVSGVCCTSNQTPYCFLYDEKMCIGVGCHSGICTPQPFIIPGGSDVCCTADQTPYCSSYSEDGRCWGASCGPAGCTPTQSGTVGICCPSGSIPGTGANAGKCCVNGACCKIDETPYCSDYNLDGSCGNIACEEGRCTPAKIDKSGVCCTADETAICSMYDNDGCWWAYCITGKCTRYCAERGDYGCVSDGCCPAGQKVTIGSGNNPDTCT